MRGRGAGRRAACCRRAGEPAAEVKRDKLLHAYRLTGTRIDGVLDDEAWNQAETAEGLVQWDPDNGDPMSERTQFQIAYDGRFIYAAVRCADRTPDEIAGGLGRRDELPSSDTIGMGFDPRHDHQTGYAFITNPSAVQFDITFYNDQNTDRDFDAARWGHLVFDAPLAPPRRVEWQPYVRAGATGFPDAADEASAGAGVDLCVGLGTGTTLAATVNPDFGQVEQDPAVLNLTVFETFFPEKRPFFLEDSRTFVPPYGLFQLFHSRRIGRAPRRFDLADDDTEIDPPTRRRFSAR